MVRMTTCGFCLGAGRGWWTNAPCVECEGRGMVEADFGEIDRERAEDAADERRAEGGEF